MVILAIDYGDTRTGLARSDALERLASPVGQIKETYAPKLLEKIQDCIRTEGAQRVVLGLPRNMDGSEGFRAQKCREFGRLLEDATGLPVDFWDERLTTVRAHQLLNQSNTRGKKRKGQVDALSAVLILQDYLDAHKKS